MVTVPRSRKIERVISRQEFAKLKRGCQIVIAYTRHDRKAYKIVGFLRRCPEDD